MHAIDALPVHMILAALLWLLAAVALWQGIRGLARGLCEVNHPASALRVVRGIRGVIFLGEELYETWVILLALRAGQRGVWA